MFDIFIFIIVIFILGVQVTHHQLEDVNGVPNKFICSGYSNSDTLNLPSEAGDWGLFVQTTGNGNDIIQFLIHNSGNRVLLRVRDGVSNWRDWHTIYTDIPQFYKDYASLSALATALGVFKYNNTTVENPDDVLGIGGTFSTEVGTTYKPFYYAVLISFPWPNDQYAPQVLFNLSSGHSIAYRLGKGEWHFIDATTV